MMTRIIIGVCINNNIMDKCVDGRYYLLCNNLKLCNLHFNLIFTYNCELTGLVHNH